jgi:hypothetical protein
VGLAWAHFDVEVVTDIQDQLEEDPKAPLQAIRRDQAALLHSARIDRSTLMLDGNSFATIERLHRQEVISTALALFFQYPSLAVAV